MYKRVNSEIGPITLKNEEVVERKNWRVLICESMSYDLKRCGEERACGRNGGANERNNRKS